jgi:hypothetical protein
MCYPNWRQDEAAAEQRADDDRRDCVNGWRHYQKQAEAIVSDGEPIAINRRINAAYAQLWLDDRRFQWAGLAAFASKQVGCGLLHAADMIGRSNRQRDAYRQWERTSSLSANGIRDARGTPFRRTAERSNPTRARGKLAVRYCAGRSLMTIRKMGWAGRIAGGTLALATLWGVFAALRPVDEVVMTIDEPYEQVRRHSRSSLPILTQDNSINLYVRRPAVFRFNDVQYGFVTPAAKFLSLFADEHGKVRTVTLSPQTETLPLDATMAILLDLQRQLTQGGWRQILVATHPPMTDTPEAKARMRANRAPQTFWLAGDKYQVSIDVRRFIHENRPADERYLITLQVSGPPLLEDW